MFSYCMKKTTTYNMNDLLKDVDNIIKHIKKNNWKFNSVMGIPRGGLFLAVLLSYRLDIPLCFDNTEYKKPLLVVDDISDNGDTLIKFCKNKHDFKTITLFSKKGTKFIPDYNCNDCKDNEWIVFAWERKDSKMEKDNTI